MLAKRSPSMNEYYTDGQVEAVLNEIGIDVVSNTDTNALALCPFHNNNDTPALSVDREKGIWMCFSPSCGEKGTLMQLVMSITKKNVFVAKRTIENHRGAAPPLRQYIDNIIGKTDDLPLFSQDLLNRLGDDLWGSAGQKYMNDIRSFNDPTLSYFQIGYSKVNDMVTIPVHDWNGNPVGMVGRSITGKRFKNSNNLPSKRVLFNTHRAKKYGEKVIIVESSMDAMKVHQAGFPYVVATNGSIFSSAHVEIINRYWNEVIIMTDFDNYEDHRFPLCKKCESSCLGHNPGRALGEKMILAMPSKRIKWACYDYGIIYPHEAKDAGGISEEEITQCINNAVTAAEYEWMKRDVQLLSIV